MLGIFLVVCFLGLFFVLFGHLGSAVIGPSCSPFPLKQYLLLFIPVILEALLPGHGRPYPFI